MPKLQMFFSNECCFIFFFKLNKADYDSQRKHKLRVSLNNSHSNMLSNGLEIFCIRNVFKSNDNNIDRKRRG